MIRLLARLRREQAGLSLIELLIAIAITAVIATLGSWMFVAGTHSVSLAQSVDGGTRQASNGMNQAARMLRAATPNPLANPSPGGQQAEPAILAATPSSVAFYAYVNLSGAESPVMARFSVDGTGRLIEEQWNPTSAVAGVNGHWTFPDRTTAAPALKRPLCNSIPGGSVVFRYFDKTGSTELLPTALTTDAQRAAIASIQVTITIQPTGAASAVTLTNTISMANVGTGA